MKKRVVTWAVIIFGTAVIFFSGYMLNNYVHSSKSDDIISEEDIYVPSATTKTSITDTIINGIGKESSLITTEITLSSDILIDDSYLELDILKKQKILNFYGTALFSTNLDTFSGDDIHIFEDDEILIIYISKPQLSHIYLDNSRTVVNKTETGLFRFGDIKLTSADFKTLQSQAITKMTEQLNNDDIKNLNEYNTKNSVKELFQKILEPTDFNGYDIIIEFK